MDVATQTEEIIMVDTTSTPTYYIMNPVNVHIQTDGDDDLYDPDYIPSTEEEDDEEEYEEEDEEEEEDEYEDDDEYEDEDDDSNEEERPPSKKRKRLAYIGQDKEYFSTLTPAKQKQILSLEEEVEKVQHVHTPLRFRLLESPMDLHLKSHAIGKLNSISRMDPCSGEYNKMMNYVESLSRIPIGKYKNLPVNKTSTVQQITSFLAETRKGLDSAVYGHDDAKQQIIRLLAQWISNPQSKGLVIGIEGHPGVGKTKLVKDGICKVLGLPFGFVPLGGVSDGSFLVGHSYTYEGSRWGRIVEILMHCGCMNPILFFDELDKVSGTRYGEEIINILIHLTDSTQSDSFHDKYFSDIALDMSRCLIVFSYNHGDVINPILKDRMITIKAAGYTAANKVEIFQNYMLPELEQKYAFKPRDVMFSKEVVHHIIEKTPDEQGVRNLRRSLDEILSKINLARLLKENIKYKNKEIPLTFPLEVTENVVEALMTSSRKYANESLPLMYI